MAYDTPNRVVSAELRVEYGNTQSVSQWEIQTDPQGSHS